MSAVPSGSLIRLSGRINNYKCTSDTARFVFDDSDKTKLGVIAVAAAAAGLGAQAMSTASNSSAMEEVADFVEFEVEGQQVSGWLWKSPLRDGDIVDSAIELSGNGAAKLVAVRRKSDGAIALYPHCSRGRLGHWLNALKWSGLFLGVMGIFILSTFLYIAGSDLFHYIEALYVGGGATVFLMVMCYSLSRRYEPFARVAEKCFATLGLNNPSRVDLVKSTKALRKPNDPPELGTFYFKV